jgi:hypothetical protein
MRLLRHFVPRNDEINETNEIDEIDRTDWTDWTDPHVRRTG